MHSRTQAVTLCSHIGQSLRPCPPRALSPGPVYGVLQSLQLRLQLAWRGNTACHLSWPGVVSHRENRSMSHLFALPLICTPKYPDIVFLPAAGANLVVNAS